MSKQAAHLDDDQLLIDI